MDADKCGRCGRYVRAEGSDLCAPCMAANIPNKSSRASSEGCRHCVQEHFVDSKGLLPFQRFRDPMCHQATPWCLYYEAALKLISRENYTTAMMLSRVRSLMKQRAECRTPMRLGVRGAR